MCARSTRFGPRHLAVVICLLTALSAFAGAQTARPDSYRISVLPSRSLTTSRLLYTLPSPSVMDAGDPAKGAEDREQLVVMGDLPLHSMPGKPVLPVVPARILLPAGRTIDRIEVVRDGQVDMAGKHVVVHGRKPIPLSLGATAEKTLPDPAIYASDAPYPARPYELVTVQRRRGAAIAHINLHPVEYRPRSGSLTTWRILTLHVTTRPDPAKTCVIRYRSDRIRPLREQVDNPDLTGTYRKTAAPTTESKGICNPGETNEYVIVTSAAIMNATTDVTLHDLVAAKEADGLTATIVTIESVLANYTGTDNAEKLRNFIIDAYNNWETDFVLLGGDTGVIPYRNVRCNGLNIPADMYFQCLDGNYNHDGDGNWGEWNDGPGGSQIDLTAEVYIGRASAENADEMSHVVYKTLAYANAPASSPFLRKAIIAGQYLGSQFGPGVYGYAKPRMEEIRLGASTRGYTTVGFVAYEGLAAVTMYRYDGTWTSTQQMVDALNSENHCILTHLGHGNTTYGFGMSSSTAANLANDAFFFGIGQDCFSGAFDSSCLAEAITSSTRHGAVAVVLNSRYGLGSYCNSEATVDGPSQRVMRQFWDAYFGESVWHMGALNADSHEDNIWCCNDSGNRQCVYESNLFGDPHTWMRGISETPVLAVVSNAVEETGGGDVDGFINPGESVNLILTAENVTPFAVTNVTATLTTTNAFVTLTDSAATFGDMAGPRIPYTALDPFSVQVASNCPPGTVAFTVLLEDILGRTWEEHLLLQVVWSYRIGGQVTLDGAPLAGAEITYAGPYYGALASGTNGSFLLHGTEGIYWLDFTCQDYLPPDTLSVSVPPAREDILVPFTTALVTGHVYDASSSTPVQGATITYDGPVTGAVVSAADGSYSISRVFGKAAELTLVARKPGSYNDSAPARLTLPPNATDVDFLLDRSEIVVSPTSMAVVVCQDDVVHEPLRIYNVRGGPLMWETYGQPVSQPAAQPGGEILESLPVGIPGSDNVKGCGFDGTHLWIGHGGYPAELSAFRVSDGERTRHFELTGYKYAYDMAWDGEILWVAAPYEAKILAVEPETGEILHSYDSPFPIYKGYSIAYGEGALWVAHNTDGTVHKLSTEDASILDTFSVDAGAPSSVRQLAYFNGRLWYPGTGSITNLHGISTLDGSLQRTVPTPIENCRALTSDDWSTMWMIDTSDIAHRLSMGTVTWRPIPVPSGGDVAGHGFVDTLLAFDAHACVPGIYEAVLHILSNDLDEPDLAIPVTCTVLAHLPTGTNYAPVAFNDVATMDQDDTVVIDVLANDFDPDGDPLALLSIGVCEHGTVSNLGGASVRYTPNAAWSGLDGFSYTVQDGRGGTNAALVQVRVQSDGCIEGFVTACGTGAPVPDAVVAYDGPLPGSVRTGPDGSYRIEGVSGQYTLVADKPNVYFPSSPRSVALPGATAVNFEIGAPEIDVSPDALYVLGSDGCNPVRSITIENSGNLPLSWSLVSGVGHGTGAEPPAGAVDRSLHLNDNDRKGIATDGTYMWHAAGYGINRYRLSDGVELDTISVPQPYGLAWGNSNLWTCGLWNWEVQYVYGIDPADGTVNYQFTMPTLYMIISGIAFGEGSIWIHDHTDGSIYRMDPKTGVIINAFTLPPELPTLEAPIAFYEGCLWLTSTLDDGKLYKVGTDGTYLGEFNTPILKAESLSSDADGLWILDYSRLAHHVGTGWVTWLEQNSRNGSTAVSSSTVMQFGLNGDIAGIGVHTATLYFYANDINEPVTAVPITFTVAPGGNNDADADGIPDDWEVLNAGGTNAVPGGDPDGDGMITSNEYVAGTCAIDPASCFTVDLVFADGAWCVQLPCVSPDAVAGYEGLDRYYALEERTNLLEGAWTPVPGYTQISASVPMIILTNTSPAGTRFIRGKVWLEGTGD